MATLSLILLFALNGITQVSFLEGAEYQADGFRVLTQEKTIKLNTSYWLQVKVEVDRADTYVMAPRNWYMRDISFYDQELRLIEEGGEATFYLEKGSHVFYVFFPFPDEKSSFPLNLQFLTEGNFLRKQAAKNTFQIAFASVMIFLILASLFFLFQSNDRIYLYYALYIFSILIFFAYQYGLFGMVLPMVDAIPPTWFWIYSATLSYFYILFAQSFLKLRFYDPLCYRVTVFGQYFIGLVVLIEVISYLLHYDIQHQLWYKGIILMVQLMLMAIIINRIYLLKSVLSKIFLIGLIILLATTLAGQMFSTMRLVAQTNIVVQCGLLIEVFILFIGLSIRVGIIQRERGETQMRLIQQLRLNEQLQKSYNSELQKKVLERTRQLEIRNRDNEILLKEVHHRVKNNLQMVTSLLNMQQRRLVDTQGKETLITTKNRVLSIGLIHEHLYKNDDFSQVHLPTYIKELTNILIRNFHHDKEIECSFDLVDLYRDIDLSVQVGLIYNEIITNSLKYAFQDHPAPKLQVCLTTDDEMIHLTVKDNGLVKPKFNDGFGWVLIKSILESVSGEHKVTYEKGIRVNIWLKDSIFE